MLLDQFNAVELFCYNLLYMDNQGLYLVRWALKDNSFLRRQDNFYPIAFNSHKLLAIINLSYGIKMSINRYPISYNMKKPANTDGRKKRRNKHKPSLLSRLLIWHIRKSKTQHNRCSHSSQHYNRNSYCILLW